ncbi:MAG: hypothetical protein CMB37_06595 [Euryarchaeota archaeon]|nr:hypothetical protein [Euryarchaeota archaeon]|tara:strand:+ start:1324 stop:2301 length:978 start_codon:yes stop_codon:yes gene_type:complete
MRRGFVVGIALTLMAPMIGAEIIISQPQYSEGDWFEYDGWTASVFAQYETKMVTESADFEFLSLTEDVPMRITFEANENANLGGQDVNCRVSQIDHSVNMTVHFTEGTTDYVDDMMTLNVSTTIKVWMPTGASGYEKRVETILVESWFSGGGEDNYIESKLTTEEIINRDGLWPNEIEVGDEWDFAETISRTTVHEERVNRALWNETSRTTQDLSRQVTWTALEETTISTGDDNLDDTSTLKMEQQIVGEARHSLDWYHEEGFLVKTQHFDNDTLVLSATLTDRSYASENVVNTVVTDNGIPSISLLATLVIIGFAATKKLESER